MIMVVHGQGYEQGWSWSLFKINSYLKDKTDRVLKYCDKVCGFVFE